MAWLPKSRTARRRLTLVGVAAGVLVVAVALVFFALGDAVSFFYLPSDAKAAGVPVGRTFQLGGLVREGSVVKHPDGQVEFVVIDNAEAATALRVVYRGELPDLFREGQGVVAKGAFVTGGDFRAEQVLAKHDEKYMPRELEKALKESGEWRGDGSKGGYQTGAYK